MLHLVLLTGGLKLLDGIGLRHFAANDGLVLLGQLFHLGLNLREVVLGDNLSLGGHHIVEETILHGRSESELYAWIKFLQSLGQQVGGGVPECVLALFVIKLKQLDGAVLIDGTVQLGCLTIDPTTYNVTGESR